MDQVLASRVYDLKIPNYDKLVSQMQNLANEMNKLDKAKVNVGKQIQVQINAGNTTAVDKLNNVLLRLMQTSASLNQQRKELSRLSDAMIAGMQREAQATDDLVKQKILQEKLEQEQIRTRKLKATEDEKAAKQARQEQKIAEDLSNEYKQLSLASNELSLKAKNYAITLGENHPVTLQAVSDAKNLSDFLKRLDASVGQFGRSVGDYANQLRPAFESIREQLLKLKTEQQGLQDLSQRNPIGFQLAGGAEKLAQVTSSLNALENAQKVGFQTTKSHAEQVKNLTVAYDQLAKSGTQDIGFLNALHQQIQAGRPAVNNYSGAFNNLRLQTSQLLRETPALALNTQTFILALSNNLPLFFEAIERTKKANVELAESGQKTTPVFGQIVKSLFSVQSLLTIGVTLFTLYGTKIIDWIGQLFTGKKAVNALEESLKSWNTIVQEGNKAASVQITTLKLLYQTATDANKPMKERLAAVQGLRSEFPAYFSQLDTEIILNGKAKQSYLDLAESIKTAARATAAKKQLEDLETQRLNIAEQKQKVENATTNEKARAKDRTFTVNTGSSFSQGTGGQTRVQTKEEEIQIIDARKKSALDALDKQDQLLDKQQKFIEGFIGTQNLTTKRITRQEGRNQSLNEIQLKQIIEDIDKEKAIYKEGDAKLKELQSDKELFQKRLDALQNKKTTSSGSRLEGGDKDRLSVIESQMNTELALEETRITELKKNHDLSYNEEAEYLNNVRDISVKYLNQKIALFESQKNLNAKELETLAGFRKAKSDIELKTQKDIEALSEKELQSRSATLKKQLEAKVSQINVGLNIIQADPNLSEEKKVEAKAIADQLTYNATKKYYDSLIALAIQYKINTVNIEAEKSKALNDLIQKSSANNLAVGRARLEDIKKDGERSITEIETNFAKARQAILSNEKLTESEKKRQLDDLDKAEQRTILSAELNTLNKEVAEKKRLLDLSLISNDEYLAAVKAQQEKAAQVQQATNDSRISTRTLSLPGQGGLGNLIKSKTEGKIKAGKDKSGATVDESELFGELLAQSYQVAQQAMQGYFDAEEARIQRSKELAYQRIDLEKQQALVTAQSQAEKDAIEKESQVKKQKADREAGEKLKKVKRSEAAIAFATELANIAVAAASNPLNGVTLGAAGVAMYGILATLAAARYALNLKAINTQQFAGSGKARKILTGKISGPSNIPTQPNGDDVLATVKVGEVVLNEEHQKKLGGAKTFAAIGVPGFSKGGKAAYSGLDYSGPLGDNLHPPISPSDYLNLSNGGTAIIQKVFEKIDQQSDNLKETARQIHQRIDKIKVQVVAGEVEQTNNDVKKVITMGTL